MADVDEIRYPGRMVAFVIAIIATAVLAAMSLRADARFRRVARLPMQWSLGGRVTWSARRRVALAFTPALATGLLVTIAICALRFEPRPGQEGEVIPAIVFVAVIFVVLHALHLSAIDRTLRSQRG